MSDSDATVVIQGKLQTINALNVRVAEFQQIYIMTLGIRISSFPLAVRFCQIMS